MTLYKMLRGPSSALLGVVRFLYATRDDSYGCNADTNGSADDNTPVRSAGGGRLNASCLVERLCGLAVDIVRSEARTGHVEGVPVGMSRTVETVGAMAPLHVTRASGRGVGTGVVDVVVDVSSKAGLFGAEP